MQVGYIGLGAMGGALARRLLQEHILGVCDLNRAAVAAFEKLGAFTAICPADLARRCDVVLLCLPRSSDVLQVIFGPGGLAEGLEPGKIVIDQTSGIPGETQDISRQLADQGVTLLDAPVAGGVPAAEAGTITIMVSGPGDGIDKALPVLKSISPNVFRCGDRVGNGHAVKLVNNVMNAGYRLATLEIAAMGRKMGLSLETITDVLNRSSGRNRISQYMLPGIIQGKPSSNFALSLMVKDVNQAIELGMECGAPMLIAGIVRGLLQTGVNTLGEKAQLEDVAKLVESMAGTSLLGLRAAEALPSRLAADDKTDELTVGYVGLGAMGSAVVRRMLGTRTVHVYDVRLDAVRALEADGALAAADLPSLARACDVILICLPTSAVVREALLGDGGLAEGLVPGKIVVDQTTGDPEQTQSIAADLQKLGVALVDAPVSGGSHAAYGGTISFMCGGPTDAYAKARPILESMSPNIVYCGETGKGHLAKLVNNAVGACNRLITYESIAMGVKYGLSIDDMAPVINSSSGGSSASERILPLLASGGQTATFRLELMVKDLRLASQLATRCGAPMLVSNMVRSIFEAAANKLGPEANLDEIAYLFEEGAGIRFDGSHRLHHEQRTHCRTASD